MKFQYGGNAGATIGAIVNSTGCTGPGATINFPDCTGPGATIPELRISDIPRLLSPCDASHNLGRNTPIIANQQKKIIIIISTYINIRVENSNIACMH